MMGKQTSIINQNFTCKNKINESNTKVSTWYWIVWLYSKYVCFYVFMLNVFYAQSISVGTCSTSKQLK